MKNNNFKRARKIGFGNFGTIFEGIHGQHAVDFLIQIKSGEVINAFYKSDIGSIDLIWGMEGQKGYGLAHIIEKHPEIIKSIAYLIKNGSVIHQSIDRLLIIDQTAQNNSIAIIRLDWNGENKKWLVSAFEKA